MMLSNLFYPLHLPNFSQNKPYSSVLNNLFQNQFFLVFHLSIHINSWFPQFFLIVFNSFINSD